MPWSVVYSPSSEKFLSKLEHNISHAIFKKIRQAKENPHHYFERLTDLPYYDLRVGDYRVIADLQDKVQIIAVVKIGHRKNVYFRPI